MNATSAANEHTKECDEIRALLDMTREMVRTTWGRAEIPHHLAVAARQITLAHMKAHRTCVLDAAMFGEGMFRDDVEHATEK